MEDLLREYVTPMLEAGADHLVLGCTHYPFLIPCLQKILPKEVQVVDCSPAVAKQVGRILEKYQLLSSQTQKGTTRFYCTGSQKTLAQHTSTDTPIQALNR